jgi:uncharacterized protein YndB with AHSA1/START domain
MIDVKRTISAGPEQVWAVLADGWSYPLWVVGASHMREVEPDWPAPGSRIHHSVGPWPLQVKDSTTVLASDPGRYLELEASMWPTGAAQVWITLTPQGNGATEVAMSELFIKGPLRLLPEPVQDAFFRVRNTECLARLADITENREAKRRAAAERAGSGRAE